MMLHVTGSYHVNRQRWPWYRSHTPRPLATFHFRHRSNSSASRSLQMYNIIKRTSRGQLSEQHLPTEQLKEESYIYKQTSSRTGSLCVFVYGRKTLVYSQNSPGNNHHHCLYHMDVLSRTGYSRTAQLCCQICPVAICSAWNRKQGQLRLLLLSIWTCGCHHNFKIYGLGENSWAGPVEGTLLCIFSGMHNQEVNLEARNFFSSRSSSNSNRQLLWVRYLVL